MKKRLSSEQREAIIRDYLAGEKVVLIAARHGVNRAYPGVLAQRRGHALRLDDVARSNMAGGKKNYYAARK